jgi:hypothetical protein
LNSELDTGTFQYEVAIIFYALKIVHEIKCVHERQTVFHWHERCRWKNKCDKIAASEEIEDGEISEVAFVDK